MLEETSTQLVNQLNCLLTALEVPIPLQSPMDLTPSLLLAILESMLSARLPLSRSLRDSLHASKSSKVECMKIFLGVLQDDYLHTDVGLSQIDPRKLAKGCEQEVIFVGELLCWIGRRAGLLPDDSAEHDDQRDSAGSPSTVTTVVTKHTANTNSTSPSALFSSSSRLGGNHTESNTSVGMASHDDRSDSSLEFPSPHDPRCIHEIPSPSLVLSPANSLTKELPAFELEEFSYCDCSATVRYSGYIEPVDEDIELDSFEKSRREIKRRDRKSSNKSHQVFISFSV